MTAVCDVHGLLRLEVVVAAKKGDEAVDLVVGLEMTKLVRNDERYV